MAVTVMCGRVGAIVGNVVFGALVDLHCVVPIYIFGTLLICEYSFCSLLILRTYRLPDWRSRRLPIIGASPGGWTKTTSVVSCAILCVTRIADALCSRFTTERLVSHNFAQEHAAGAAGVTCPVLYVLY
ncbi:hypothetical protein EVAR_40228_1 [Eumeta japonica]|uniref:Uncharacterized protein n=1 Tax=Eumeta variegata TaxID=151549 RepID=A0A4C1XBP5_EUMVA|nr:hypothetical protein EVAR_40228_1 [Eumeta japonica]